MRKFAISSQKKRVRVQLVRRGCTRNRVIPPARSCPPVLRVLGVDLENGATQPRNLLVSVLALP